jgi:Arf-GAP with coiled-coil, ANK repeat and PH domain-containing protein
LRGLDPDWASLSFGILICIKCSGIHRSLGVHLSKVRSLALDFWNPEHVELMKELGNERSKLIFEEAFDDAEGDACDSDGNVVIRAEPNSSQQVKESWIYSKYVKRKFVKFPSEAIENGDDEESLVRSVSEWLNV